MVLKLGVSENVIPTTKLVIYLSNLSDTTMDLHFERTVEINVWINHRKQRDWGFSSQNCIEIEREETTKASLGILCYEWREKGQKY